MRWRCRRSSSSGCATRATSSLIRMSSDDAHAGAGLRGQGRQGNRHHRPHGLPGCARRPRCNCSNDSKNWASSGICCRKISTSFSACSAANGKTSSRRCDIVRHSPLIGPKIPVHGLLLDIETGKLDWVVNGYQALDTLASRLHEPISPAGATPDLMKSLSPFHLGEMKFPEGKIGELATKAEDWLSKQAGKIGTPAQEAVREVAPVAESVERAAKQVTQYAEKHWPKPPSRRKFPSRRPSARSNGANPFSEGRLTRVPDLINSLNMGTHITRLSESGTTPIIIDTPAKKSRAMFRRGLVAQRPIAR